jgi:hypothetical protein
MCSCLSWTWQDPLATTGAGDGLLGPLALGLDLTLAARRYRGKQADIEAQPGDDADVAAHRGEEFQRCEAAVADHDDAPLGQPAAQLPQHLSAPVEQRLVPLAALAVKPLGRRRHGQERQPLIWHSSRYAAGTLASFAQVRPASGMGASSISDSQHRPEALTKWLCEERTGAR